MNTKKLVKIGVFTLVSILLIWLLLRYVSIDQIQQAFSKVTLRGFLLGFLFYFIGYWIRAARFFWLLGKKIKLSVLFCIVCLHNMINSVVPARIGELSYVYFVKKRGVPVAQAAASLVVVRIFDLLAVMLLFLVSLGFVWETLPPFFLNLTPYVIGLLVALSVFLLCVMLFAKKFLIWFKILCKNKWFARIVDKITEFTDHLCKNSNKKKLLMLFGTSMVLWVSQFLMVYFIFVDVMHLSFWHILMGSLAAILSTVLPVQGIGGFGSMEGAWALAFIALGISQELAIASGFVFHFAIITYFLPLGLIGWIGYTRNTSKKRNKL